MKRIIYGILLTLVLTACDQKELCFDHSLHAGDKVDFKVHYNRQWQITYPGAVDWERAWGEYDFGMSYASLRPQVPSGLRVLIYNDQRLIAVYNIDSEGGDVNIHDDDNSVLMINNDSEFIVYSDLDSISDATATTRTVQRSTYQGSPYVRNAPRLVNPPDMLYHAFLYEVDDDDDDDCDCDDGFDVRVVMEPVVFTYVIRYHFVDGLDYVAIARGALAGMASDVWLETGYTSQEAATVLYDCEVKTWGVEAVVRSFGAPSLSPDQKFGLNLEVRLKNGKILDYNFDVTSQLALQPKGGVIDVGGIEIPDDVGKEDPGVFDVTVEGWGEFEDIPVNL